MNWDNPNKVEAIALFQQKCERFFRQQKITQPKTRNPVPNERNSSTKVQ